MFLGQGLLMSFKSSRSFGNEAGAGECVPQLEAKGKGYADVVYLDAKEDKYIEEVSSCNMFVVKGKTIRTPPAG